MPLYSPGIPLAQRLKLARDVLAGQYHVETHVSEDHREETHLLSPRISSDPMPMRIGDYDLEFTLIGTHITKLRSRLEDLRDERLEAELLGYAPRVDRLNATIVATTRQLERAELECAGEHMSAPNL